MFQFTKPNLTTLRVDIDAALKAVGEKHGLKLHAAGAKFGATAAEFKLVVASVASNGVVLTQERQNFSAYASMYGLKPELLDRSFSWGGKTFKIVGINPKKHKRPICCDGSDGKSYVFPAEDVKRLCAA